MGKLFRGFVFLLLIVLISISLTSGLELTASTGGSSTHVVYGATVDDYANEHIGLNPGDGTLSNAFSGSGSLPSSSISKRDTKGNYVWVSRSINGKSGITKWNYDWSTYTPTSSTAGSGVGAQLSMTANNAYGVYGAGYASNSEGDIAKATLNAGALSGNPTTSVSNYYINPTAFTNKVRVDQNIAAVSADLTDLYGDASSTKESDLSKFDLNVYKGKITTFNFYATSGTGISEQTKASIANAYGTRAEIISHAENKWTANEKKSNVNYGGADFAASNPNNKAFSNVIINTQATLNDLDISATGFSKTALILEPFKSDNFGNSFGSVNYNPNGPTFGPADSAGSALVNKGYAVTYYRDSGVSWEKVSKLDEYTISMITTHGVTADKYYANWNGMKLYKGDSAGLEISKSGVTSQKSWTQLRSDLTTSNDMIILDGCDTFHLNVDGTRPGANAVKNAKVSGGFTDLIYYPSPNNAFINTYFTQLCAGDNAATANGKASMSVGSNQILLLQGTKSYKLT